MASDDLAEELAAPTPTPGGGAAAARAGLFAASLLQMVTGITLRKVPPPSPRPGAGPVEEGAWARIRDLGSAASALGKVFRNLEAEDRTAFEAYLEACRLPRGTPEEKERRRAARSEAAARATRAPLAMLRAAIEALHMVRDLLDLSTTTPLKAESDLGVSIELAHACFRSAEMNVRVNLPELTRETRGELEEEWRGARSSFEPLYARLRASIIEKIEGRS